MGPHCNAVQFRQNFLCRYLYCIAMGVQIPAQPLNCACVWLWCFHAERLPLRHVSYVRVGLREEVPVWLPLYQFLSNFKWPEDPLNLVKIKNPFWSFPYNLMANAWWVQLFWIKIFNLNTLMSILACSHFSRVKALRCIKACREPPRPYPSSTCTRAPENGHFCHFRDKQTSCNVSVHHIYSDDDNHFSIR